MKGYSEGGSTVEENQSFMVLIESVINYILNVAGHHLREEDSNNSGTGTTGEVTHKKHASFVILDTVLSVIITR